MQYFTGKAKLDWSVYSGEPFKEETLPSSCKFTSVTWSIDKLAQRIAKGSIVAWVEGRYEMGPRALGHRSLLAEPFSTATRDRLNHIKQRESYRPIAPICLEEDVGHHFFPGRDSPYMLQFYQVTDKKLQGITHVDGSARVQTLRSGDAPFLGQLLTAFRRCSGYSVLCNTSLNFKGRGFINNMSDLIEYCESRGLDGCVVNGRILWDVNKI